MSAVAAAPAPRPAAGGPASPPGEGQRLRVLSYNIQVGIATTAYHHYLTGGWRHFLPDPRRRDNLDRIARMVGDYDVVGLQETDAGSLRSGFVNQAEYLAREAPFPHWYQRTNRNLGKLAQHSLGLLTRYRPAAVEEHKLPGVIPGRGLLLARYGTGRETLAVVILHLALGRRTRMGQLAFVAELVSDYPHAILMGDLNCRSQDPEMELLRSRCDLEEPRHDLHTFPSWRPNRNIDHILISPSLRIAAAQVLTCQCSDHLPVAMELVLPATIHLPAEAGGDGR